MRTKGKKTDDASSPEIILKAAIDEFAVSGFYGARIDSIAKRSGINKAMIYYHFKSKEQLYRTIIDRLFSNILTFVKEYSAMELQPDEKLYALFRRVSEFIGGLDDSTRRLMIWELASGGKTLSDLVGKRFYKQLMPLIKKLYQDGIASGKLKKEINPIYTHISIVGAIIFSNIINMTLKESMVYNMLFERNFQKNFTDNLLLMVREGIEKK